MVIHQVMHLDEVIRVQILLLLCYVHSSVHTIEAVGGSQMSHIVWRSGLRLVVFARVRVHHLTLRCDGEYCVWSRGAVDIRRVSDWAREGPIIVQRGVDQRDGGFPARRASLPPDTTSKLTVTWRERPWGEVEKLEADEKKKKEKWMLICMKQMGAVK